MPVPAVRLKIRVRFSNGSRAYVVPVYSPTGKLKPLYAVVNGKPSIIRRASITSGTSKLASGNCSKTYMEQINRQDVLNYLGHLKKSGNVPRTVANYSSF